MTDPRLRTVRRIANLQQRAERPWFRIVRNDAGGSVPTRVDVYDDIGGGGWFGGGVTAADFTAQLAEIPGDLEVHINSGGGDVFDGIAIYNAIAQRPGNVTTVVDGIAASIASIIAQAGKTRIIAPGAMMMIHDALSMCLGNASDMRETADLLDQVSDNLASIYASRGGTPSDWRATMQTEAWYTAEQAVAAGLADQLAERPAAPEDLANHDLSMFARVPEWLRAGSQPHGPMTGTHSHPHPAYGSQGGDASHDHEHTHDGDAHHGHSHATTDRAGRVLGIESMPLGDKALPVHHTATVDEPWNGPAAVAAMPNDDTVLEYCHAWEDSAAASTPHREGDDDADDQKANYKFPHHKTKGGPANVNACTNGLARLSGADIPDADRAGVEAHLRAHLADAGKGDAGADDHVHLEIHNSVPFDAEQFATLLKEGMR